MCVSEEWVFGLSDFHWVYSAVCRSRDVKWRANTLSACRDDNNFLFFWNIFCLLVLPAEMQAFCSLLHMQCGEVPLNPLVKARFFCFQTSQSQDTCFPLELRSCITFQPHLVLRINLLQFLLPSFDPGTAHGQRQTCWKYLWNEMSLNWWLSHTGIFL